MSEEKDSQATSLFLAAVPLAKIKAQVGFRDVRSAEAAIVRGLHAAMRGKSAKTQRLVELERLDMMYRAQFPKALKGDPVAAEKCLKIGEARARLVNEPDRGCGVLAAFERSVAALNLGPEDEALVASGRAFAQQVDYAVKHLLGQDVTKALYLLPNLVNVLRELGATPQARASVTQAVPERSESNELDAWRASHRVEVQ